MTTLSKSIEFLDQIISKHVFSVNNKPLFICISGPQGSGKSYITDKLTSHCKLKYKDLNIHQFLMDDLYLTHEDQNKVTDEAKRDRNLLLQGRGLPGTHDLDLAFQIFDKVKNRDVPISIPIYDKSLYNGQGDRSGFKDISEPIDVILFEGWFNAFSSISDDQLRLKYLTADDSTSYLKRNRMCHIADLNSRLKVYEKLWNYFDHLIYFETDDINNVFEWRIEQEHNLIQNTGNGMSDEAVKHFIGRYMPVYELYYKAMCTKSVIKNSNLKLVIDKHRNLISYAIC